MLPALLAPIWSVLVHGLVMYTRTAIQCADALDDPVDEDGEDIVAESIIVGLRGHRQHSELRKLHS